MKSKFHFGSIVMTSSINELSESIPDFYLILIDALNRHGQGDWGCICDEDKKVNNKALLSDGRLLSAYPIDSSKPCKGYGDNCFWIITEADRSVTTILLPEDY